MDQYLEFVANHPLLFGLLAAVIGAIGYTEYTRLTRKYKVLGPADVVRIMNQDQTVVVDVREEGEARQTGKIAGARHIPLTKFKDRFTEINKFKDKAVVVYCQTGARSGQACNTLVKNGFENVVNLQGGVLAWESAGLPLSKK
ncbi:rhodanese-like domain-containing protein [Ectothiorhodospira lacustris]|uniref:rhodanese-like domain-containing protein n=1 Tax=Ectothiorhodospira lacustris TaxID=2899127 RepID=UPI001EE86B1A|nr:rhodanese-like domain-containing protein [Ectothiorhodospira lacustris]MCG5499688.1 rhodanese-like domain-containing protein [Ectothiorhodospira lacustris]MCG5509094.1 rhodanese-like domain-containing protein [Ectothiorhodospira lacustris]MCG5520885.1 rhodanese-like domain-containing protein [Ectothiorhodospira lacustris]